MKLNVTVDLEDFMEDFSGETLNRLISEEIKEEVLKAVKKDSRYKQMIAEKTSSVIDSLL